MAACNINKYICVNVAKTGLKEFIAFIPAKPLPENYKWINIRKSYRIYTKSQEIFIDAKIYIYFFQFLVKVTKSLIGKSITVFAVNKMKLIL